MSDILRVCPYCQKNNGNYQLRWSEYTDSRRFDDNHHQGVLILVCSNCRQAIEFDGRTGMYPHTGTLDKKPDTTVLYIIRPREFRTR